MNPTFKSFFHGDIGNKADDFYFKYDGKGAKIYYSKITGKRIKKSNIPQNLVEKIQPYDSDFDTGNLLNLKKNYMTEIQKLQDKIKEIDIKLEKCNVADSATIEEKVKKQKDEDNKRREEYKRERKREEEEFFRKLYERMRDYENFKSTENKKNDVDILEKYNIKTRKEWRKWLLNNHPDKGGDDELCSKIINAGRSKGW